MNTVKNLNLVTTILYIIRTTICAVLAILTLIGVVSAGGFTGNEIKNTEEAIAGIEKISGFANVVSGLFITIILYVLLALMIIQFISTLIPSITNIVLRKKYKRTNEIKILRTQTNFNLIYTSISFGFLLLTAFQEPEMLIIGIPTIITEIFAIISFIVLNNKKEEVI